VAKDRFTIQLKCLQCGRMGAALIEEADDWASFRGDERSRVNSLSEGFVKRRLPGGSDEVLCSECKLKCWGGE
jgi:hypothetical protein